jgi:UDPglucose 6-dehydrogenase/GDP-mannose 6-dehydrogenase
MEKLYADFADVRTLRTNLSTAEMIKYASNALLATMISFSNEFANLCGALGDIDVVEVMKGVHLSRYLSTRDSSGQYFEAPINAFLGAGCGFGGSCLPKDVKALIARGDEAGVPMRLLDAVMQINERQPAQTVALLKRRFPSLAGLRVAVLGLAFKPDTSDIRESPALPIIRQLIADGAAVRAYDPVATEEARNVFPNGSVEWPDHLVQALEGVDAIIVVTRWREFGELPELLRGMDPQPLVVDARRMLDKSRVARYAGIGLGG